MKVFKVGDKPRIISVPEKEKHWINKVVTVVAMDGFGYEEDDICVRTDTGQMLNLKEHQLKKV